MNHPTLDNFEASLLTELRDHVSQRAQVAAPSRKRVWTRATAFGLSGLVIAGGTAYAVGLVPEAVSERFQQITGGDDGWPYPITNERLVADVPMSNGKHARVWMADTTDGQCVIRDMTDRATKPENFGAGCALWCEFGEADLRRGVVWLTSTQGPTVAYGDFTGTNGAVATVEVSGADWSRTFDVAEHAFAGEIPTGSDGDTIRFRYLNAAGKQVASKTTTVFIESE